MSHNAIQVAANRVERVSDVVVTSDVLVAGGQVHRPGWLAVTDGVVVAAGPGSPPEQVLPGRTRTDLGAHLVVPGFVDIHVHGGGGASFTADSLQEVERAIAAHRAYGTTLMCASLVSAHPPALAAQVERLGGLVESGALAGTHLEGPWLSPRRLGAHDGRTLRAPDLDEVRRLLDLSRDTIRMVTIAPELPGALEAIAYLHERGVVAAVGHTDATYDQTREAIAAGATVGTHVFNAMRPIGHREPGPVIALTEDPGVVVEVIADGVHLHPAMYDQLRSWVGPDRIALVTDAMAAAGMPDGPYTLGALDVTVAGGIARLTHGDSIAGGTGTTDRLFRVAAGDPSALDDTRLLEAVAQTSAVPRRALGLPAGDLGPGSPAALVALSPDLAVARVLVPERPTAPRSARAG